MKWNFSQLFLVVVLWSSTCLHRNTNIAESQLQLTSNNIQLWCQFPIKMTYIFKCQNKTTFFLHKFSSFPSFFSLVLSYDGYFILGYHCESYFFAYHFVIVEKFFPSEFNITHLRVNFYANWWIVRHFMCSLDIKYFLLALLTRVVPFLDAIIFAKLVILLTL